MTYLWLKRQMSKAPLSTLTLGFLRQKARVQLNRCFIFLRQMSKAPLSTLTLGFLRQKARVQLNRTLKEFL